MGSQPPFDNHTGGHLPVLIKRTGDGHLRKLLIVDA